MNRTGTQAAYAAHRGVSKAYVSQMKRRGKLPIGADGIVDFAAADAALAAQADPDMAPVVAAHAARRQRAGLADSTPPEIPAPPAAEPDPPMQEGRYVTTPMSRAKTADAVFSAKTKQLEYERSVGKLVESAEVARAIAAIAPALTQFDGLPERLVARLRAAPDERAARMLLADEIACCRQAVADFCLALIERSGSTAQ